MVKMPGFVGVEVIFYVLSGSVKWSDCRLEFWMSVDGNLKLGCWRFIRFAYIIIR